ncbi:MAG: helix-turn-helix transcriptional regulator [Candidatus Hydrothermarchaeaceae archaeon]
MMDSKQEILNALTREDLTVDELCEKLGISPTAVRQHLESLAAGGHVVRISVKQERGRPKFVYSLTEKGEATLPKAYQEFLERLMDELLEYEGIAGIKRLLTRAAKRNAVRYKDRFEGKALEEKVELLGEILNEIGAHAEIKKSDGKFEIDVYNCLLSNVAKKYDPVICEYDATLLETLLGRRIKKIRSKTKGEKCCSFEVYNE